MGWLRPEPHRGDVVAAGAVPLAALVVLLNLRFDDDWARGVHLALTAAALALVLALALLAPAEGPDPRAYQSALYVCVFVLALVALLRLAEALGAEAATHGRTTWVAGTLSAVAAWFAVARGSAVMALLGAVALGVSAVAAVLWISEPDGIGGVRWVLLALWAGFVLAAVAQRDRRHRLAVMLADAAALAGIALALTFGPPALDVLNLPEDAGWGWEMVLYATGFGALAFAAVEGEPGPGWLGAAVLVLTTVVAAPGGTLLGWPLVLALGAGALLVTGLRPSRPLPPAPDRETAPVRPLIAAVRDASKTGDKDGEEPRP